MSIVYFVKCMSSLYDLIKFTSPNWEMIFAHRYQTKAKYLSLLILGLEICFHWIYLFVVDISLRKSSSLKNDWIIYRFVYAWPYRPYIHMWREWCKSVCILNKQLAIIYAHIYQYDVIEQMYSNVVSSSILQTE